MQCMMQCHLMCCVKVHVMYLMPHVITHGITCHYMRFYHLFYLGRQFTLFSCYYRVYYMAGTSAGHHSTWGLHDITCITYHYIPSMMLCRAGSISLVDRLSILGHALFIGKISVCQYFTHPRFYHLQQLLAMLRTWIL